MPKEQLIPHLFRSEFSKLVAVLCKTYGLSNIQLAEDFVSDTFLKASESWGLKGVPKNPTAWLYKVAKNKAKDYFKHQQVFTEKVKPTLSRSLENFDSIDFSEHNIKDSQLQMIFAICTPKISTESQICLALKILCGFGISEISDALLSNKQTINKRLLRAKEKIRKEEVKLEMPIGEELNNRIQSVLLVLYLLFNEGYYSNHSETKIKKELCIEAMRILLLLIQDKITNSPECNALMALFCFHSSRFDARTNETGDVLIYEDQDPEKWDYDLIEKGEQYLNQSAKGNCVSKYHLEAIIAFWHTQKSDKATKWENILQAYNKLLQIDYSPIAALNRTYALAKIKGNKIAITEALKIDLKENHLYHSLLAELYASIDVSKQKNHFQLAIKLCKNEQDKLFLEKKLSEIKKTASIN